MNYLPRFITFNLPNLVWKLVNVCRSCFCLIRSYLLHLSTLPLACWTGDFDGDSVLLSLASQSHSIWLQRAEGDFQLRPGEAACPAVLCGNLRWVEHWRKASGALWDHIRFKVKGRLLVTQERSVCTSEDEGWSVCSYMVLSQVSIYV